MNCYSVYMDNHQVRVYAYSVLEAGDYLRAEKLALNLYDRIVGAGYSASVEQFHMCSAGKLIKGTDNAPL